jgi:hypothetical protein
LIVVIGQGLSGMAMPHFAGDCPKDTLSRRSLTGTGYQKNVRVVEDASFPEVVAGGLSSMSDIFASEDL